jgi:hypothetical protein
MLTENNRQLELFPLSFPFLDDTPPEMLMQKL